MSRDRLFTEVRDTKGIENKETKVEQVNSALFCFDFDQTISSEHIQNKIKIAARKDPALHNEEEKQWLLAETVKPRSTPQRWRSLFEKLINDGHQIAILSFNEYPNIIKRYLKEKLNITDELLDKIYINSAQPGTLKSAQLDQAILHFKRSMTDKHIVLVDDSEENIDAVKNRIHPEGGVHATTYDVSDTFLTKIVDLSEIFKNKFIQEQGRRVEDDSKTIVLEIKKRITQTNWPVTGFFGSVGGDVIRLDDESPKSVPKHVRLQWMEIRSAELGYKPFSQALSEVKKIGSMAAQETNYWRDLKITQAYYDLFLEAKQQEFVTAFRKV